MRKFFVFLIILSFIAPLVFSLELTVGIDPQPPVIDGSVGMGEYTAEGTEGNISLYASRNDEGTLFLAVSAETDGWIALGLGSDRMAGSHLVMGYRDGSEAAVEEHTATGHFHRRSSDVYTLEAAVDEENGMTTLEFALPEDTFYSSGKVQLILAYGKRDNFVARHREYQRAVLRF